MSGYEDIQTAAVIRYPFLWAREAGKGETEGRKDRPVAVGVRIPRLDGDLVLFFPITTKQPEKARFAAEIPTIEKRRQGSTQICGFGSFSTSSTAMSSVARFILSRSRRLAASARHSSSPCFGSSSRAANP